MHNASEWNPRWVEYASANNRTPEDQLAHDKAAHPGASMMSFILWCSRRNREAA